MATIKITRDEALRQAGIAHHGAAKDGGALHEADTQITDLLYQSLTQSGRATRAMRGANNEALDIWSPKADQFLADKVNIATERKREREKAAGTNFAADLQEEFGLNVADQYTGERLQNQKTEVLSRIMVDMRDVQTPILNNFYVSIRTSDDAGTVPEQVAFYEAVSDWSYHPIDPDRGELKSIEVGINSAAHRVRHVEAMYGVMLEYERFRKRVFQNASLAELFAIVSVGWAKASSRQRELDATKFLTKYIDNTVLFDNSPADSGVLGQTNGIGLNGLPNGSFNMDYDFPMMLDHMISELGMDVSNLKMLLPRGAWHFMNRRKGYSQFLGTDGNAMYQRPNITKPSAPAGFPDDQFGIRYKGTGPRNASAAANFLTGTREANGAAVQNRLISGLYHNLPNSVPNWAAEFQLPNSAFGPMTVVLTPYEQPKHATFPDGHPAANDPITGLKRPVTTTDIMIFDGNKPFYIYDSIPATNWHAEEDLHRRSTMVMIEGWHLAATARGQQAVSMKSMVLEDDNRPDFALRATIDSDKLVRSQRPVGDGIG